MDIKLSKLEHSVSENDLLKGELLLEEGKIQQLFELEKHLWLAKVEDGQAVYEVEVKITPSKVVAVSCECVIFKSEGMCPHIVAVLLAIRKRITEIKERKPLKKKTATSNSQKLTTKVILNNVTHDDLIDFVREFAQKNRNFAIALKARFASSVDGMDHQEKYRQLIETTISASRKADRTISKRGIQKIDQVLQELQHQIESAISLRHYTIAFAITRSIIEKITPILRKLSDDATPLLEQVHHGFKTLSTISRGMLAPELQEEILEYCLAEADKRVYRSQALDHHFFDIAQYLSNTENGKKQILEALNNQENKYQQEDFNPILFLKRKYQILSSFEMDKEAEILIDRYINQAELLITAVKTAIFTDHAPKAKSLALRGLEQQYHPSYIFQLEELLLEISQATADNSAVIKFAEKRFLVSFQQKYFDIIKEAHPKKAWKNFVDQLLQKLNGLAYSIEKPAAIALVLSEEGRVEPLKKHLKESRSIDLLIKYGKRILHQEDDIIFDIYQQILNQYLNNHLGRTPSVKIRTVIAHLHEHEKHQVASQLVQAFRNQYAERHSLMEELAWFV